MQFANSLLPLHYAQSFEQFLQKLDLTYMLELCQAAFPSIALPEFMYCRDDQKLSILKGVLRQLDIQYTGQDMYDLAVEIFQAFIERETRQFNQVVDFINAFMRPYELKLSFVYHNFTDLVSRTFKTELADMRALAYVFDKFFVKQVAELKTAPQRTMAVIQRLRHQGVPIFLPIGQILSTDMCDERLLAVAYQYVIAV